MKNDITLDDPCKETPEDIEIVLDVKPNMEYILTRSDGFVCDLTLNTLCDDSFLAPFQESMSHLVLHVGTFQVKRCEQSREIIQFVGDAHERICIIEFEAQTDIDIMCDLAIKHGVKAFIVKYPPNVDVPVPVFQASFGALERMIQSPDALVIIKQKEKRAFDASVHNGGESDSTVVDGNEAVPVDAVELTDSHQLLVENSGVVNLNLHNGGKSDATVVDGNEAVLIDVVKSTESHQLLEDNSGGVNLNHQVCVSSSSYVSYLHEPDQFSLVYIKGKYETLWMWTIHASVHCYLVYTK